MMLFMTLMMCPPAIYMHPHYLHFSSVMFPRLFGRWWWVESLIRHATSHVRSFVALHEIATDFHVMLVIKMNGSGGVQSVEHLTGARANVNLNALCQEAKRRTQSFQLILNSSYISQMIYRSGSKEYVIFES